MSDLKQSLNDAPAKDAPAGSRFSWHAWMAKNAKAVAARRYIKCQCGVAIRGDRPCKFCGSDHHLKTTLRLSHARGF